MCGPSRLDPFEGQKLDDLRERMLNRIASQTGGSL